MKLLSASWIEWATGAAYVSVVVAILLFLAVYFGWWLSNRSWERKGTLMEESRKRPARRKERAGNEPLPMYEDPWDQGLRCKPVDPDERIATVDD